VLSVLATLVGLATSLGLGVQQVNAGLHHLFGLEISTTTQVILIAVITGFATMSVVAGLDKGVKLLSQGNMLLAALFMLFLLMVGPTVFTQNLGYYATIFPDRRRGEVGRGDGDVCHAQELPPVRGTIARRSGAGGGVLRHLL
jgi:choline-glycine betaine transporter